MNPPNNSAESVKINAPQEGQRGNDAVPLHIEEIADAVPGQVTQAFNSEYGVWESKDSGTVHGGDFDYD